ncbi:hypothetical protein QUA79_34990 [Microcoleus sp. F8-D1]
MGNKARNTSGKFAPKSEVPRKVRSVNLTDAAWQWLAAAADKAGMSRNDYLEALASGNSPFTEMAQPLSQPFIETAGAEIETRGANGVKQPNSELLLFIEMAGLEVVRADNQRLHNELGNLEAQRAELNQELAEIQLQLAAERALREKIERELSEKKQNSVRDATLSEKLTLDAAAILGLLRAKRKKSAATLADVEVILEVIEG